MYYSDAYGTGRAYRYPDGISQPLFRRGGERQPRLSNLSEDNIRLFLHQYDSYKVECAAHDVKCRRCTPSSRRNW